MGTASDSDHNEALESALSRLVGPGQFSKVRAAFDVKRTSGETIVFVDLPGVDEDDIQISESRGQLTISATREFNHDLEDAEEYTQLGRSYGAFQCSVDLPPSADANAMTAKYTRGVLKVRVPNKKQHA
jgi:HSP20 family protein